MQTAVDTLVRVCRVLAEGAADDARRIVRDEVPFQPSTRARRSYSDADAVRVFQRDGFCDRYSGQRLVYPGTLKLISVLLPDVFPYHPNWKLQECHVLFWQLSPTVDHVIPVSRGGSDDFDNWVCTSMLRNSAKSNWTLDELGWSLLPVPERKDWDGLLPWFTDYVDAHRECLSDPYLRRWRSAAAKAR